MLFNEHMTLKYLSTKTFELIKCEIFGSQFFTYLYPISDYDRII